MRVNPYRKWTDAEIALLRQAYPHTPAPVIAKQLGRNTTQIYQKAAYLGLVKAPEFYQSSASGRI